MVTAADKPTNELPSATPTDAELDAWTLLPRDEQARRYKKLFQHPDCNTFTPDTPDDILALARERAAARRHG